MPPSYFLVPEFGFFQEELWEAVVFDFRVVFVEPFGRPRLACGFDFFGEVFTSNDVSERRRPTSLGLFVHLGAKTTCQCAHTDADQCSCLCDVFKVWREAHIPMYDLISEDRHNHHHDTWGDFIFGNYVSGHFFLYMF